MAGFFDFFRKKPLAMAVAETNPNPSEVLWADSLLYTSTQFERYNPDELISRKGYQIYQKMMNDEQIKAAVRFRRNAVTSRQYAFEFSGLAAENLSKDEQTSRINLLNLIIERIRGSFSKQLNFVMMAMWQGYSITEKTYDSFEYDGETFWGIKGLRKKPWDTFYAKTDDYGDLEALVQRAGAKEQEVDLDTVIWYVMNPEVDEYYGQSELREAYRSWYSKDIITKLENLYLERMAGGLVWAEKNGDGPNSAMSPIDKAKLESVLRNIQTSTGIRMPDGYVLKVNNPSSTDAFSKAIERHDRNLAKALLMPNLMGLTESGQTGSYAQSKTQMEGFLWMLDADARDLEECLNEQLFYDLCEANFGDGLYPKFKFKPLSKDWIYKVVDTWNSLVQSGAVTATEADEKYIRELLDFPEKGDELETDDDAGAVPDDGEADPEDDDGIEDHDHDHTLVGNGWAEIAMKKAFSVAQRRVDFAAIERNSTVIEWQSTEGLSQSMGEIAAYLAEQVTDELLADPMLSEKVKVPTSIVSDLRKQSGEMLKAGWDVGSTNAKREVEKAGRNRMSKSNYAAFASVGDIATKYFKSKAFQMAGNLANESLAIFKNVIANGIKYSKPQREIIEDMYTAFAKKGMLTEDQAMAVLSEALELENPTYRLATVVRTNTFEAINEARYEFFTDDDVSGFVSALQYSAILDSRTTDVCTRLDDVALRSGEWTSLRPPNHYNCRSLLVPITINDEDVTISDEAPEVTPGAGFA